MAKRRQCPSTLVCVLAFALFVVGPSVVAIAQDDYPSRPIRLIVPFAPGTLPDVLSRLVGPKLVAKWGQPVIVENRPGATGNIGAEIVAAATPDGYTLLSTPSPPLAINQSLYAKLNFDPNAFAPVTVIAALPNVLVVPSQLPASTLEALITLSKASPDQLNCASTGNGSTGHLSLEMLKAAAGVRITHVPYSKGLGSAMADLLAGRVDMMFVNLSDALPHIRSGALKAIAIGSETSVAELPEVPPLARSFPGFHSTAWYAVVAPPKTPTGITAKLSAAIAETLKAPDIVVKLRDLAVVPIGSSPAETAAFIEAERTRWRNVIISAAIKLD